MMFNSASSNVGRNMWEDADMVENPLTAMLSTPALLPALRTVTWRTKRRVCSTSSRGVLRPVVPVLFATKGAAAARCDLRCLWCVCVS